MATIKELLSTMIDKINDNKDKIDNIKGVPEAFDSITMTNGTDMANLTMSAEKELLFNGEAIGGIANWDELENKPFYSEEKMIELLPETTVTITEDRYAQISETIRFVKDKKYNVIFNGTKYECAAWDNGEGGMIIGNGFIYGGNGGNNEPFSCDSYDDKTCYLNVNEPGSYTISISCLDTDVKKIDPKYLPESGSSGGALFVELNIDEETIITPFEEIENAINDNRDIITYFQNTYLRLEHYVKNYMDDGLMAVTLSGLSSVNKVMFVIEIVKNGTFSVTPYGIELAE